MNRLCIIGGGMLLFLGACSQNGEPTPPPAPELGSADHYVSVDDAVRIAREYVGSMNPETRSDMLELSAIETLGNKPTRSGEPDDNILWGYYVINFENDGGFALVSADDRNRPVYALSDEGKMVLSDTVNNIGLRTYINNLPSTPDEVNDWVLNPTNPRPDPTMSYSYKEVAPILTTSVRTWDQWAPFNKYCPKPSGSTKNAPVGCLPLAVGMLMSYYEWPTAYNNIVFDWNDMKSNHNSDVLAKFLKILGDPENLNAQYGVNGTSAYSFRIVPTFKNMGYTNLLSASFSEDKAVEILKQKMPILVTSESRSVPGSEPNRVGHAWVMDGLYVFKYMTNSLQDPQYKYAYTYYPHCVWGWGGLNNGYYYFSGNQVSGAPQYTEPEENKDEVFGSPWTVTEMYYGAVIPK